MMLSLFHREGQTRKRSNTSKSGENSEIKRHDSEILTKRLNSWPTESRGYSVINLSACTIMEVNISCTNAS